MKVSERIPPGLSPETRRLWREMMATYRLENPAAKLLLRTACEAVDRLRQAQKAIKNDGVSVKNRYGMPVAHPALRTEAQARQAVLQSLKQLRVDPGEFED